MHKIKNFLLLNPAVIFAAACIILYFAFLQFISPAFYDPDSYYHAAVTGLIKNSGLKHQFDWAQFSLFKDFYSDKDLLGHLLALPFFYLSSDPVVAGKYSIIFYNILFILAYAFILRKYLPDFLAACLLIMPAVSSTFIAYFGQFRSVTIANILTLLAIYFMINKKLLGVFIISLLYPLAHISFFMLLPFVLVCETLRYAFNREFSLRNVYAVLFGIMTATFIHPNFPNNLLSFHLNGILVPLYTLTRLNLDFGGEFNSSLSSFALTNNFSVFFIINAVLWISFFAKKKWSFPTLVWLGCGNIYLALSFFSNRYWYPASVLFYVFFASYVKDLIQGAQWKQVIKKSGLFIVLYMALISVVFPLNLKRVAEYVGFYTASGTHYKNAAAWMKRNIPAGETIYHSSWSDSPYFMCFNPGNNYITALDPIYMLYRYPEKFKIYQDLIWGRVEKPYEPLQNMFKVHYGYTKTGAPLYAQIAGDPQHFKIVYEDNIGAIFKLITPPTTVSDRS